MGSVGKIETVRVAKHESKSRGGETRMASARISMRPFTETTGWEAVNAQDHLKQFCQRPGISQRYVMEQTQSLPEFSEGPFQVPERSSPRLLAERLSPW